MGKWSNLTDAVAAVIRANGNREITGQVLQNALLNIISNLGNFASFAGVATPSANPGVPDGPVYYFATQAGTYANFGALVLDGSCYVLYWNGTAWSSTKFDLPTTAEVTSAMNSLITTESTTRQQADTSLQSAIAAEATRAAGREDGIDDRVEALEDGLTTSTTTRTEVQTTWSSGYIGWDGKTRQGEYTYYSDYVQIDNTKTYNLSTLTATSWYIGYYSATNENSLISVQQLGPNNVEITDVPLTIPNGAVYFRATKGKNNCALQTIVTVRTVKDFDAEIEAAVAPLDSRLTPIEEALTETETETETVSATWNSGAIDSDGTVKQGQYCVYNDFLPIESGCSYKLYSTSTKVWYIGYYSSPSESGFISSQKYTQLTTQIVEIDFVIPAGALYYRVTKGDSNACYLQKIRTITRTKDYSNEIVNTYKVVKSTSDESGTDAVGMLPSPSLFDADLCYLVMYGQSFTLAEDGGYMVTENSEYGNHIFVHTSAGNISTKGDTTLRAPAATREFVALDCALALQKLIKKYLGITQDILCGVYGEGSRSCYELSKNNGMDPDDITLHRFENKLEPGMQNAVTAAQNSNKSIVCPAILYLQGESDISSTRINPEGGASEAISALGDKDTYKTHLLNLKNQMQAAVLEKTGQTEKPLFFVYVCGNQVFNSQECGIQQAVLEMCEENEDMFNVGPYYVLPTYSPHPTPDGRRWLGEQFAKHIFDVMIRGNETTMSVKSATVDGRRVILSVKTPTKPLVINTWNVPQKENYGFQLFTKTSTYNTVSIASVEVLPDTIILNTNTDLSSLTNLYVTYANSSVLGYGNICDSGRWRSLNLYESNSLGNRTSPTFNQKPLDKNGNELIGQRYPMQEWMPPFGIKLT